MTLMRRCLNRMVAKVLSTEFVVRKWLQCSAGGAKWCVPGAEDFDRYRSAGNRAAAGAGQVAGTGKAGAVHVVELAAVPAKVEVPQGTPSVAVPQMDFNR